MILILLMASITLAPIEDAVRYHDAKTPVGSRLRTAEWEEVAIGLRNASQFSAGVEQVRVMALVQRDVRRILSQHRNENGVLTDRSGFIRDLTGLAEELGLAPVEPEDKGTIRDITSERRAELILEQQVGQAYGHANWKAGQDAEALDAAPAQELVRIREAKVPRDWVARWRAAGGQFYGGGRMIARKDDPIWERISRFGNPWPPFDFNSGMWVEDVSRAEAIELGVIDPGSQVESSQARIDDNLSASVAGLSEEEQGWLKDAFGDQVQILGNRVEWQGSLIKDFVSRVLDDPTRNVSALRLGMATARAVDLAQAAGVDIQDVPLLLESGNVRKIWRDHGNRESRSGQRPITRLDFELIPHVFRSPDAVTRGQGDALVFSKELLGKLVTVVAPIPNSPAPRVSIRTMYKKEAS